MKIQTIPVKNLIVKSNLPASDYVINPYIGCSHKCHYCYASFMKRFTGHSEAWGSFVDIKQCSNKRLPRNLAGKTLLLSSVTDPYQPLEKSYGATRQILQQLVGFPGKLEILTKSHLVTRDIDLFHQFPKLQIGLSLNTLNDRFRQAIEPGASSVAQRLNALKTLSESGIYTYLFISPIFPELTEIKPLIAEAAPYVKKICFENLNLRGSQIPQILSYIESEHPHLLALYQDIYLHHNMEYWKQTEAYIGSLKSLYPVEFVNYFYHAKKRKEPSYEHSVS